MNAKLPKNFSLKGLVSAAPDNAPTEVSFSFLADQAYGHVVTGNAPDAKTTVSRLIDTPIKNTSVRRTCKNYGKVDSDLWSRHGRPVDAFLIRGSADNYFYIHIEDGETADRLFYFPVTTDMAAVFGEHLTPA